MSGPSSNADQRAAWRLGAVLGGKYTLTRVLGVGGMAAVYLGIHRNGNRVAVKILHPVLSSEDDVRARFLREGYVANSIGHPGAVRVLDDDVAEDGSAFLVMELLEGETLEARRVRLGGRLPLREALALGHQLLDVLGAAHDKGVVHRDIKPDNLFLTRERQLKVLDFGIARLRDSPGASGTWVGARMGTPAFMPPEQALGRTDEVDARSDLWAAGATLFTLLSGGVVHDFASAEEIVVRAATRPAPSLATRAPDTPAAVVALIDRALAFDRADRWPSAREMGDAIAEVHASICGEPPGPASIGEVRLRAPAAERAAALAAETLPAESGGSRRGVASAPSPPSVLESSPQRDAPPRSIAPRRSSRLAIALAVAAVIAGGATYAALRRSRAPVDGRGPGCDSAAECVAALGGKPAVCRAEDHACVALESPDCQLFAEPGDIGNDGTLWIGAMFPKDEARFGEPSFRAVDLARRDFVAMVGGLPPARPGGPMRPIAVVACDDRADAARVATHLVDEVRVPAIIGFARSKEVLDLAASHFQRRGVLALAANMASMLRDIPRVEGQPRLVWRVTTSADGESEATVAVAAAFEAALRREGLREGEPMRVAVLRIDNASGVSFSQTLAAGLRFNGKGALENGDAYRQLLLPDSLYGVDDASQVARVVDNLVELAPHLVIDAGARIWTLIREVEARWPAGAARPRWIVSELDHPAHVSAVRAQPDLRSRLFGVDSLATPALSRFTLRHNEVFSPKINAAEAVAAPYDAFYVLALAAAALGPRPITGVALARALPRLLPPGPPFDVGPGAIYPALTALSQGGNIDLQGAITSLDFDLETGESPADFAVFCLDEGLRPVETGLVYEHRTRQLRGTLRCR